MTFRIRILAGALDVTAGSHVYNRELIRRLAARGHLVSVVCFKNSPLIPSEVEVHETPCFPYHAKRFFWRLTPILQHRFLSRSLEALILDPPDVVVGCEHLLLQSHHRKFPRVPWIYLPHSLTVDEEIRSYGFPGIMEKLSLRVYTSIQQWALNAAHRTLRFTRQGCEALLSKYGKSVNPRFLVNPAAVEVPALTGRPKVKDVVRLLCVSRLVPSKRVSAALRALASLRQYRWVLDIVGDGPCRQDLQKQASELGLEERVKFHGFQKDPSFWYQQADLFLFPSELESCGIAVLEAMSFAVPCLAMRADGLQFRNSNSEIIQDKTDGFLVGSDDEFASRLETLLNESAQLIRAGAAARNRVISQHTWDRHLGAYEQLFSDLSEHCSLIPA